MIGPISDLGPVAVPSLGTDSPKATPAGDSKFVDSLARLVESVDATATEANTAVGRMLDGSGDVHEAMIALQKAELQLQLTVQIRNKLVQAYQEIMRMPV